MWWTDLRRNLSCSLEEGKKLAPLSALSAGGEAEFFVEPAAVRDVRELFRVRREAKFPLYILGGGTNVVFADGVLRGVVLSARRLNAFQWNEDVNEDENGGDVLAEAEAGFSLPRLAAEAAERGFAGMEFAQGIPGTVGGAVAGNAGAGGRSVGDILEEVTAVEEDGGVRKWKRGEYGHSYRRCSLASAGRFFTGCKMRLRRSTRAEVEREEEVFRLARSNQPRGVKSAGCTFKNPSGDSAGRLLDISGCKGLRAGGAVVSDAHANFILNAGGATGNDILRLIEQCRDIVFQKTGVVLEVEIKLLGFRTNPFLVF
ncbi:MAG: UDP-N-acetylmuramate dehydrogenase [Synergistaceae bacterium]|jgi:UDP-N-acetylmuramate dehydrogenase|nr:UDP-N-acetylmuramate dehydrogenase [Synergistaceae bacterium]